MGVLDGRVAVVTGAGRGIGRGIAHHLAREGARVVVNDPGGSVHGEGGDGSVARDVVQEINGFGGEAVASLDTVATWEGGHRIVETALDHFGRIDILVNNAGILRDHFVHQMSEEEWDAVVHVHLGGAFHCTRAAAPHMRKQAWGRIIFITSTGGFIGTIAQCNYAAAKMGMLGLSRDAAMDMRNDNVTANCVAPFAWTRIPGSIPTATEEIKEDMDRLFKDMTPEQVSPLVVFLASEKSTRISGQVFGVRGKEVFLFSQPQVTRSLHSAEGWTPGDLANVLGPTFKQHFTPLDNSITFFDWKALL